MEFIESVERPSILVICGNKVDQQTKREVSYDEALAYAEKINALFFEASAKENLEISKMFYNSIGNLSCFDDIRGNYKNLAYDIEYENNLSSALDRTNSPSTPKGKNLEKFKIGENSDDNSKKKINECKC